MVIENTPPKKKRNQTANKFGSPELPSVSPLLKKYNESREKNVRTTIGDRKNHHSKTEVHCSFGKGNIF